MSLEDAVCNSILSCTAASEDAVDLDTVARLCLVDQVVLEDDLDGSGQLTRGCILRHLLNGDNLAVFVNAVAVLCAERILIFVFYGEHGVRLVACSCVLSQLCQVRVVRIVLDHSLLRGVTVMH